MVKKINMNNIRKSLRISKQLCTNSKITKPIKYKKPNIPAYAKPKFSENKDKTNEKLSNIANRNLCVNKLNKRDITLLCFDYKKQKTSNKLILDGITTKNNILLIENNDEVYQNHILSGFNCLFGECKNLLPNYNFSPYDIIYLDAVSSVDTVSKMIFDAFNHIIKKNNMTKCIFGYTFAKRCRVKGETFDSKNQKFYKTFNALLKKSGYKITDSDENSYGSPITGQAAMFTKILCINKK